MTNLEISRAYIGNEEVDKIYLGNTQIYPTGPAPVDYRSMPLTIEALSAGTLQLTNNTSQTDIYYNLNDGGWQLIGTDNMSFNVDAGDIIQFGATEAVNLQQYSAGRSLFSGNTLAFKVYGNIESLEYGYGDFTNRDTSVYLESAFTYCFRSCSGLTDASNLVLPATTLANSCYERMFRDCTSLTSAPELPGTTLSWLVDRCYAFMFQNCTSLTQAPELPATELASHCYYGMFYGCTNLTSAPELPAETLTDYCYYSMFKGCTSLISVPELPATKLEYYCYFGMFSGCTNLNYIKCLATDIPATNCTNNWVNGVAASGTFVKAPSMTGWTTGASGIPTNWTVEDAS